MPGTCSLCGEQCVERKQASGGYKDCCVECRGQDSGIPTHVETCSETDCIVCESWRQEFGVQE